MLPNCSEEVDISGKRHIPLSCPILRSPFSPFPIFTHFASDKSQTPTKHLVQYTKALPTTLGPPGRVGRTKYRLLFVAPVIADSVFPPENPTETTNLEINTRPRTRTRPFTHHDRTASHPASAPETTIRPDARFHGVIRTFNTGRVNRHRVPEPASRRIELNECEPHRISDEPDLVDTVRHLLADGIRRVPRRVQPLGHGGQQPSGGVPSRAIAARSREIGHRAAADGAAEDSVSVEPWFVPGRDLAAGIKQRATLWIWSCLRCDYRSSS